MTPEGEEEVDDYESVDDPELESVTDTEFWRSSWDKEKNRFIHAEK
jgi:hypothetical protein